MPQSGRLMIFEADALKRSAGGKSRNLPKERAGGVCTGEKISGEIFRFSGWEIREESPRGSLRKRIPWRERTDSLCLLKHD